MKSIDRKNFTVIGTIAKTHGTKGEFKILLDFPITLKEWVFVEIQQKPVPFFLEQIKQSFNEEAIIKLKGINSPEAGEKLVGFELLLPKKQVKSAGNLMVNDLIGYDLIDEHVGFIGTITMIEEFPKQLMLQTIYNGNTLLIPAIEPILQEINDDDQVVYIDLPEGYLEAFSDS